MLLKASGWVEKQLSSGKLQKHHWYFVPFVFIFWSCSRCSCRGNDLKSYTSSHWSITRCCRYTLCFSPLNLDSSPLVSLVFQKSTREARERCVYGKMGRVYSLFSSSFLESFSVRNGTQMRIFKTFCLNFTVFTLTSYPACVTSALPSLRVALGILWASAVKLAVAAICTPSTG